MTVTVIVQPVVDLSGLFGPVRHQGSRSTCVAFAMSDLNRQMASAPSCLSAEFLYQAAGAITPNWKPSMGLCTPQAIQATASPGQPLESLFPYRAADPAKAHSPTAPVGAHQYCSLFHAHQWTMQLVIEELGKGFAVGLVTRLTPGLLKPIGGVVPCEPFAFPNAYHAVLAVGWGIGSASNERFLLFRNSWGSAWALDGHAWLPEPFVDLHVIETFGR